MPLSVEPSLNTFNDAAFDIIDYALYAAREYGLRVVIPLTDEHDYYHGGRVSAIRVHTQQKLILLSISVYIPQMAWDGPVKLWKPVLHESHSDQYVPYIYVGYRPWQRQSR